MVHKTFSLVPTTMEDILTSILNLINNNLNNRVVDNPGLTVEHRAWPRCKWSRISTH